MKVGFLITARTKSTRLPKKIIRVIAGKPIIVHMLDRIKMAKEPEVIVICTSIYKEDDVLEEIAKQEHVECYRGHPDDVLQRLLAASKYFRLDYIVNITADCPFVGPEYIDKTVKLYEKTNADLIKSEELPHGAYCY